MHRQDEYLELMVTDGNLLGSVYGELDDTIYDRTAN